jgi:arginine exporter protein ArgO
VFATIGLSALLLTSATAYTAVKTAGAVYLVALGVQTVWASWRHRCIGSRCHLYGLLLWDTARTVAHQGIVLLASQDQNQE